MRKMEFSFQISQLPGESLVTDESLLLRFQMHWELVLGLQTGIYKCDQLKGNPVHTLILYLLQFSS